MAEAVWTAHLVHGIYGAAARKHFEAILPVAKVEKVAAINWGFVAGKSQTYLPWDSWQKPYVDHQPEVWFHDIFKEDGKAYRPDETAFIRKMTGK